MELGPVAYTSMAMTDLTGIQNLTKYCSLDELGLLGDNCPASKSICSRYSREFSLLYESVQVFHKSTVQLLVTT